MNKQHWCALLASLGLALISQNLVYNAMYDQGVRDGKAAMSQANYRIIERTQNQLREAEELQELKVAEKAFEQNMNDRAAVELKLDGMTKTEKSQLLYMESVAVDHGGKIDNQKMNVEDHQIAQRWHNEDFILYGRIVARDVKSAGPNKGQWTHWCHLSDFAFEVAALERRRRAARMWDKRTFTTTYEENGGTLG